MHVSMLMGHPVWTLVAAAVVFGGRGVESSGNGSSLDADVYWTHSHAAVGPLQEFENLSVSLPVASYVPSSASVENELCRNHSRIMLRELRNFTLWAVQMLDASAKFPDGMLYGNTYHLGNFDECFELDVRLDETRYGWVSDRRIQGQYCMAQVKFSPLPETYSDFFKNESKILQMEYDPQESAWNKIKYRGERTRLRRNILHWALCIPSSCTARDLEVSLKEGLESVSKVYGLKTEVQVEDSMCQTNTSTPFSAGEIIFLVVLAIFATLVIVGSIYDLATLKKDTDVDHIRRGTLQKVLLSYSAYTNLKKLGTRDSPSSPLDIIYGARVISMFLIILGHRVMFLCGGPLVNSQTAEWGYLNIVNQTLLNGPVVVDTFFHISGFLVAYFALKELEKTKKINLLLFYLHRLVRLSPAYLIVIAFYATIFPRLDSGPLWESVVGKQSERCAQNWWTNILYINNYVNTEDMCMFQSWYITCDFHFYLLAPLVVYPLWRWPTKGKLIAGALLFVTILIPFVITYAWRLDAVLLLFMDTLKDPRLDRTFRSVYITTHTRAATYLMGIISAYVVHSTNLQKIKMSKLKVIAMWGMAYSLAIGCMVSAFFFYQENEPSSPLESALYAALHRVGWALALGVGLVTGFIYQDPIIHGILKWKPFIPLSRLTYCAFLVHGAVQLQTVGILRSPYYYTRYKLFAQTFGDIGVTFVIALLLCLMFESPVRGLENIFLRKPRKPSKENSLSAIVDKDKRNVNIYHNNLCDESNTNFDLKSHTNTISA